MNTQNQNTPAQTAGLEVFLFKYLHFEKKLITDEDFEKVHPKSLNGCKFPVEFQVKLKRVYVQCLRNFLTETKEVRFLEQLQKQYPQRYAQTVLYLKQFYGRLLAQLLRQHHTQRMRLKYMDMMLSGLSMLADAGLQPTFGPQPAANKQDKKEQKNDK